MLRIFLRETNCHNCKYNASKCIEYECCLDCPITTDDDHCLCLEEATKDEMLTLKCKYYKEKE